MKENEQHHYDVHAELDVDHAKQLLDLAKLGWESNIIRRDICMGILIGAQSFWQLFGSMFVTSDRIAMDNVMPVVVDQLESSPVVYLKKEVIEERVESSPRVNVNKQEVLEEIVAENDSQIGEDYMKSDRNPIEVGLELLAADPTKSSLFLKLAKPFLLPNMTGAAISLVPYTSLFQEEEWVLEQHPVFKYCRLVDNKKQRIAWGTESAFYAAFEAFLNNSDGLDLKPPKPNLKIKCLKSSQLESYGPKILTIEKGVKYPMGNDFFEIDHGKNYFAFFQRLGEMYYYVIQEDNEVGAVACGIIRKLAHKKSTVKAWYLCDLKIKKEWRGRNLTTYLLNNTIPRGYLKCSRGYMISMNPSSGK